MSSILVDWSAKCRIQQLPYASADLLTELNNNFVLPLTVDGRVPRYDHTSQLPGKWKPNWLCKRGASRTERYICTQARILNLHHYHFGYPTYNTQNADPHFYGKGSSAIIHVREMIPDHHYTIVRIDHPHIPFRNAIDWC